MNRRQFLQRSSILGATLAWDPASMLAPKQKIGIQLYTLRNAMGKDPKAALEKVAQQGFQEVEAFGYNGKYFGMAPADYAATLNSLGLSQPSAHYLVAGMGANPAPGTLDNGWEQAVADAATVGQKYMIIAYLFDNQRKSLDDYKRLAERFNKAAEICKKSGIQFGYHNHDFEFKSLDGSTGMEVFLKDCDPKLVKFELDLYWASFAGKDPVELFKQHPGRFPLWHVKDMDRTEKKFFTEVGNGVIDFKRIFAAGKTAGLDHFFVEQDQCPGDPFDSIQQSIGYLKKNIVK